MVVVGAVRKLIWRPVKTGMLWSTVGIGTGLYLPLWISSSELVMIYSPTLVSTVACGGAIAILLPLGLARGTISAMDDILIQQGHVKDAVQQIVQQNPALIQTATTTTTTGSTWELITLGSGWQGRLFRIMGSPFLPSTAQMLTRIQEAVDVKNPNVVAAAASGFVEGYLQDQKDTITMLGLLLYSVVVLGGGFGLDYLWGKGDANIQAIKSSDAAQKAKDSVKDMQDKFTTTTTSSQTAEATKDRIQKNNAEWQESVQKAWDQATNTISTRWNHRDDDDDDDAKKEDSNNNNSNKRMEELEQMVQEKTKALLEAVQEKQRQLHDEKEKNSTAIMERLQQQIDEKSQALIQAVQAQKEQQPQQANNNDNNKDPTKEQQDKRGVVGQVQSAMEEQTKAWMQAIQGIEQQNDKDQGKEQEGKENEPSSSSFVDDAKEKMISTFFKWRKG